MSETTANFNNSIAILGECMLELSLPQDRGEEVSIPVAMSYGGDTLNTAVYLSRLGVKTYYFTALGDDALSQWMIGQWQKEGIHCQYVERVEARLPGLYAIENDASGERWFHYWRDRSPVRQLLKSPSQRESLFDALKQFEMIYFTGITLSLFADEDLAVLFEFLQDYRNSGGVLVFDSNYRPKGWPDIERARKTFHRAYGLCDIALPTLEDELLLYPNSDEKSVVERLGGLGIKEIIVKKGASGSTLYYRDQAVDIAIDFDVTAVDTTAAGDSFNAGFLAGHVKGLSIESSARLGHDLAGTVVQHKGAIIPRAAMPHFVSTIDRAD